MRSEVWRGSGWIVGLREVKIADVRMRVFNADGTRPKCAGTGRVALLFMHTPVSRSPGSRLRIETKAGIIEAEVKGEKAKIKLTKPENYPDLIIKINNRELKVNFINTGVPHAVIFVGDE